jgi:hypothetical protein
MAACPVLGLLVTSNGDADTLSVFALPRSSGAGAGAGVDLKLKYKLVWEDEVQV